MIKSSPVGHAARRCTLLGHIPQQPCPRNSYVPEKTPIAQQKCCILFRLFQEACCDRRNGLPSVFETADFSGWRRELLLSSGEPEGFASEAELPEYLMRRLVRDERKNNLRVRSGRGRSSLYNGCAKECTSVCRPRATRRSRRNRFTITSKVRLISV